MFAYILMSKVSISEWHGKTVQYSYLIGSHGKITEIHIIPNDSLQTFLMMIWHRMHK